MGDYYAGFESPKFELERHLFGSMNLRPGLGDRELALELVRRMYSDGLQATDEIPKSPNDEEFQFFDVHGTGHKIGLEKTMDGIPCRRLTLVGLDGTIVMYYKFSHEDNHGILQISNEKGIITENKVAPDVIYLKMVDEAMRRTRAAYGIPTTPKSAGYQA